MTKVPFRKLQLLDQKLAKSINGRQVQAILQRNTDGDPVLVRKEIVAGNVLFVKILLHIEPVGVVVLSIVYCQYYRQPFFLPGLQVRDLDSLGNVWFGLEDLRRKRRLDLTKNLARLRLPSIVEG